MPAPKAGGLRRWKLHISTNSTPGSWARSRAPFWREGPHGRRRRTAL